jgi:outer membrane putative beta-barrel porin/alpha-amylase
VTAVTVRVAAAGLVAVAIAPCAVGAQSGPPPLVTDRPSFTSAARVVGPRTIQIESGVAVTRDSIDADLLGPIAFTTLEVPHALLRAGLSRRLEVRAAMIGWIRTGSDAPAAEPSSSLSNVDLAAEYQFAVQDGLGADLAVIAGVSVPTRHFGVRDHTLDPFAQLVWSRDLTAAIDLGGMFAWSLPTSASHRREAFAGSVVFGHGLGGAWSAFWEGVGGNQQHDEGRVTWTGNVGVLRAIGDDLQLDAFYGRGLNQAAADWTVGAGVSVRFRRAPRR